MMMSMINMSKYLNAVAALGVSGGVVGGVIYAAYKGIDYLKSKFGNARTHVITQENSTKEEEAIEDNDENNWGYAITLPVQALSKPNLTRQEKEHIRHQLSHVYYDVRFDQSGTVTAYKLAGDAGKEHLYPVYLGSWITVVNYCDDLTILGVC